MVMTPRRTPTKARVHIDPPRTPKQVLAGVSALPQLIGNGALHVKANAIIIEVLSNRTLYPSNACMAKRLSVSKPTIARWLAAMKAGKEPVAERVHTPPPSPDTESRLKLIREMFTKDVDLTCVEIRDKLEHDHGIVVSRITVFRDVTEKLGKRFAQVRMVPAKYNEAVRLAFAKEELKRMKAQPYYYVFMDEFWCNATHRQKGRFIDEGEERPQVKGKERHVPKVNTFALLTEEKLHTWDMPDVGDGPKGGVTQAQFLKCFYKWLAPLIPRFKRAAGPDRKLRFMLDGAAIHGKAAMVAWAKKHKVSFIEDWPAHSPDLNPIENIFKHVKDGIGAVLQIYDMKQKADSMKRISAKRNAVAAAMAGKCSGYVKSFPRRLRKCVEKKGGHTGY